MAGTAPTLEQLAVARRRCTELDRRIEDVVLLPVAELPEDEVPRRAAVAAGSREGSCPA